MMETRPVIKILCENDELNEVTINDKLYSFSAKVIISVIIKLVATVITPAISGADAMYDKNRFLFFFKKMTMIRLTKVIITKAVLTSLLKMN